MMIGCVRVSRTAQTRGFMLANMTLLLTLAHPGLAADVPEAKPPDMPASTTTKTESGDPHLSLHETMTLRKHCESDGKRLCGDVKPGGGRIIHCLHTHETDLSAPCREAMHELKVKR